MSRLTWWQRQGDFPQVKQESQLLRNQERFKENEYLFAVQDNYEPGDISTVNVNEIINEKNKVSYSEETFSELNTNPKVLMANKDA